MNERLLNISEVAQKINRVPHTIRLYEKRPDFPDSLKSQRDDRGWRWWTEDQVEGIKNWIVDNDIRPGKGLGFNK